MSACAEDGDAESPPRIIAKFVVRWSLRAAGALPAARRAALLLGGYPPKLSSLAQALRKYGVRAVALSPRVAALGADAVADLLDAKGFALEHVIPLVDSAVAVADVLNTRLGRPANDPATASCRRDKFAQQEALRRAGLADAAQCATSDVDEALRFASGRGWRVVVKPRDSSGGDGIWLCNSEAEVRAAFAAELGRPNVEDGVNSELVVMEALLGEEWVVNTVSRGGVHRVTDAWRGPPKEHLAEGDGPSRFVYDRQFLASPGAEMWAVLDFTLQVLDAVGVQNGAAHTELVLCGTPRLYEVNARCAVGLPRTPVWPNQLEALAMSLCDREAFLALPGAPAAGEATAVVFLRAPRDGWLCASALEALGQLGTFLRFDRGLLGLAAPFAAQRVRRTTGLFSSPGAVVLSGEEAAVCRDADRVRALEATGYADAPDAETPEPGSRCCRRAA